MKAVWAVFKREVGQYFRSPVAYAIAFAMLLLTGLIFSGLLVQMNAQFPANPAFTPQLFTFLMFLIGPLLTMRLLAEEAREGTLEVLMTLPMSDSAVVIGKFLAAWFYYTVLLLLTLVHYVFWVQVGVPDQGVAFGSYLGAWLYGGAVLAVTMIWSAITEDQIVAAFLGAATVLVLYLSDIAAEALAGSATVSPGAAAFVRELGLTAHYNATLMQGILRAEDILYFIFMMIGALFITTRIIETRRWRA